MPYKRKTTFKRRTFRKGGRKLSPKQKTQVKRIVGHQQEDKFLDTSISLSAMSPTGTVIGPFLNPAQGGSGSQRIGDNVNIKNIRLSQIVRCADSTNVSRIIWFRWKDNNSVTAPTTTDVILSSTTPPINRFNDTNIENGRVKIVSDRTITQTLSNNASTTIKMAFYGRRLGNKKLTFNPALTTSTNQLYCLLLSDSAIAAHPSCDTNIRVTYTDA